MLSKARPTKPATASQPEQRTITFAHPPFLSAEHSGSVVPVVHFAFVRLRGIVCLVRISSQAASSNVDSASILLDVSIFRHEFVSMWRYSHTAQIHPAEIKVLTVLDSHSVRYEEDSGTVFLAKHLMSHLKNLLEASEKIKVAKSRPVPGRQWS